MIEAFHKIDEKIKVLKEALPLNMEPFTSIDKRIETLKELLPLDKEIQAKLDKKFRLEFNYNSNHIEGNTLTYEETELLLIFDQTKDNHVYREYEEMKAHDVGLEMIKQFAKEKERSITETDIKNLNKIILVRPFWKDAKTPDGQKVRRQIQVGHYKEHPNSVKLSNGEIFEYASVSDTPILMGELIRWFREEEEKKELSPVILAALLHYKFVRIHPFDDGNGRVSRLLMNYIFYKNDLPPVVIKTEDKKNYLAALNRADVGDLLSFIKYIGAQLLWSLDLNIRAARGKGVEDADDLEKEITVFKKQLKATSKVSIRSNDKAIQRLYATEIKKLFEEFEQKHEQFFELFFNPTVFVYLNNQHGIGRDWLDEAIQKITEKSTSKHDESSSINNIMIDVFLDDYRYNPKGRFSISTSVIKVEFESFVYKIIYNDKTIEKSYSEVLSSTEKKQIINDCVKNVFDQIKNL